MITNEKQYKITKSQMDKFLQSIKEFDHDNLAISSRLVKAQKDAFISQYEELKNEVEEYEKLKSGLVNVSEASSIDELPELLIKARIAQGFTQEDLANKLGMKSQQIQRYESELYSSASFRRLLEIAGSLNVKLRNVTEFIVNDTKESALSFPIKEMLERGWFGSFSGSLKQATQNAEELIGDFFDSVQKKNYLQEAYHKKNIRLGSKVNDYALAAWQVRILQKAFFKTIPIKNNFDPNKINKEWLNKLASLSTKDEGPILAKEYLENHGIHLIIEKHLEGTFLDGAAIKGIDKAPIVAMTLRHDRVDNFWFVLFHELGHVIKHLYDKEENEFFDDLDSTSTDEKEIEADKFALDSLISKEEWDLSPVRFFSTPEMISNQAKLWNISEAIVAGRVRKENSNWNSPELNKMVGYNKVRHLFKEE